MSRVLAAAAILLVAACAQAPLEPPQGPLEFHLLGRIAARYSGDGFTGNVDWRHARGGDDMLVSTPLGQGVARIVRQGEAVQLSTADGREYRAPDAETLTEQGLGFRLPLEGMADWVRGEPSGGAPSSASRFPDGKIQRLEQQGWRIEYLSYENGRPKLMQMSYPGVQLRFVISEWK